MSNATSKIIFLSRLMTTKLARASSSSRCVTAYSYKQSCCKHEANGCAWYTLSGSGRCQSVAPVAYHKATCPADAGATNHPYAKSNNSTLPKKSKAQVSKAKIKKQEERSAIKQLMLFHCIHNILTATTIKNAQNK